MSSRGGGPALRVAAHGHDLGQDRQGDLGGADRADRQSDRAVDAGCPLGADPVFRQPLQA
jgi:hypothetical protein